MTVLSAAAMLLAGALDSRALFERVRSSVVQVQVLSPTGELRGLGSGFAASADGMLITNHHVIDGANGLLAVFSDGHKAKVIAVLLDDPEHDIAVLKIDQETTPLPFGNASAALVGDEVMLVGSPFGLDFTVSVGAVARYRPDGLPIEMRTLGGGEDKPTDTQPVLQLTAPAGHGNSGGPVIDANGAVLGIVQSGIGGHGNFTFAVPSQSLQFALKSARQDTQSAPRDPRLINVGISALAFSVLIALYRRTRRS